MPGPPAARRHGKEISGAEESFAEGLLEYPHYHTPQLFEGLPIPDVLLSGITADRGLAAEQAEKLTANAAPTSGSPLKASETKIVTPG